jgi:hypothetical protein
LFGDNYDWLIVLETRSARVQNQPIFWQLQGVVQALAAMSAEMRL